MKLIERVKEELANMEKTKAYCPSVRTTYDAKGNRIVYFCDKLSQIRPITAKTATADEPCLSEDEKSCPCRLDS